MTGCALVLVAGLAAFLEQKGADPDSRAVARHFSAASLDGRCDRDGNIAPAGDPCTDSRGYRFVLHREGRFDVYLISDGPHRVLSRNDDGFLWSPDRALDDGLLSAFGETDPGA
jgi:hypothetical protein